LLKNEAKDLAVCLQDAWKSYGHFWKSTTVLHGITLHVPRGIMYVQIFTRQTKTNRFFSYGLLGPSGCGKTTLLRCIVGRLELNEGSVDVLGHRPGSRGHQIPGRSVGYMPQETALYKNFSISEMLHYFGRLHNMNRKDILSREQFLLSFLDLPSRTRKVSQLRFDQLLHL
jgi:ABC-type uncharacterized transport system ATPase subunit